MRSWKRMNAVFGALGMMASAGCTLPGMRAPAAASAPGLSRPGRWEEVRRIEYDGIPAANLDGDIGPAYLVFPVTLAGFLNESYGISVGPDDDVRYTNDGGDSWTKARSELFCRHGLEIVDEETAWVCGNGGVRVSTDGARTWRTAASFDCSLMSFLDARSGWAASTYVLRSTSDGGTVWQAVDLPTAGRLAAIHLRTADDGYLLDTDGNLFVTADGGGKWEQRSLGLKPGERLISSVGFPLAALRFLDSGRGMAVFDLEDGSVWFAVTADGGRSWQRAEIPDLRGGSRYYHLFLSRDLGWLTATDDFNSGKNISVVMRYREAVDSAVEGPEGTIIFY
jgi:photosystem II stability/assembly factor-like uncharacterized protein